MSVFNYLKRGLRKAGLLPHVKRLLTPLAKLSERHRGAAALLYLIRLVNERLNYAECTNVHDLPAIFHYWTNRYLLPKFEPYGFSNINSFFTLNLEQRFAREDKDCRRFISIGSGNCDSEIVFAKLLMGQGHENFTIECLDINQEMLERGKALAEKEVSE